MGLGKLYNTVNKAKSVISKPLSILSEGYQIYDTVKVEYMMMKYGGRFSRGNQYKFILTLPPFLQGKTNGDYNQAFDIFIKSISVPSTQLSNKVVRLGTGRRATPGVIDTDIFTITMYDTEENFFHTLFNTWKHSRTPQNGEILYYPDDYKGSGSVFRGSNTPLKDILNHLYNSKNPLLNQVYSMEDIWPVTVGDLRFDDDDENSFQVFDVSFYTNRLQLFDKEL